MPSNSGQSERDNRNNYQSRSNAQNSSRELTLPLLVARIAADHIHRPLTAHNLAVFTNSLDAGTDFHDG
jgi:hypothetical protein